jgi:hypothetical protein
MLNGKKLLIAFTLLKDFVKMQIHACSSMIPQKCSNKLLLLISNHQLQRNLFSPVLGLVSSRIKDSQFLKQVAGFSVMQRRPSLEQEQLLLLLHFLELQIKQVMPQTLLSLQLPQHPLDKVLCLDPVVHLGQISQL